MSTPEKTQRADARRNRERLLQAAVDVFAEAGSDASLEAIAKRAGVGIGTLYRHFPTRADLVVAAYRAEVDHLCDAADELLADRPPAEALEAWMERWIDYISTKRGMIGALAEVIAAGTDPKSGVHEQMTGALSRLLAAGQQAGAIRDDMAADDVLRAMSPIWGLSESPGWDDQARRLLRLLVDGLRTRPR